MRLRRDASEAARARALVRDHCRHLSPWQVQVGQLLTSELVTNAIVHGEGEVDLSVQCDEHQLWVEVTDQGPDRVAVPATQEPMQVGGRGLAIVRSLATRCGVRQAVEGKTVWFLLTDDEHGRAADQG